MKIQSVFSWAILIAAFVVFSGCTPAPQPSGGSGMGGSDSSVTTPAEQPATEAATEVAPAPATEEPAPEATDRDDGRTGC